MKKLNRHYLSRPFTHIYIEKQALEYPETKSILSYFPNAQIVLLDDYKEFFCRSGQNYHLQKQSQKLVLAVKKGKFIYEGPEICQDFGQKRFYYTSPVINCIYDCEYCFLQGMYPSGNILVFVNILDYFSEVKKLISKGPLGLSVSYDTDILALSGFISYTAQWIEFARENQDVQIEIRTKSVNYKSIRHLKPVKNIILAWTILPEKLINLYEKGTPSMDSRLKCIQTAMKDDWKIRLCFDPVILIPSWQNVYEKCIHNVFSQLDPVNIDSVSVGTFRMNREYFKKIRKIRPDSLFNKDGFTEIDGVVSYEKETINQMEDFIVNQLSLYVNDDRIFRT